MIKLYSGESKGKAWAGLGCQAATNWDYPAKLEAAAQAGVDVWPLVQLTSGSIERLVAWCREHPVTHIMLENEPLTQKTLSATDAARRISQELLPTVERYCPSARRVLGGFLIETHPYADIRADVRKFVEILGAPGTGDIEGSVMAFHPYLSAAPALEEVPAAAEWFRQQIEAIATDWPMFAITEWGVLRASYSGKDVMALSEYMRRTWDILLRYQCYAAAWYMCAPNSMASAYADIVLCWDNGTLKPLGLVYKELPQPAVEPEPATTEGWVTDSTMVYERYGRMFEIRARSKPL